MHILTNLSQAFIYIYIFLEKTIEILLLQVERNYEDILITKLFD